MRRWIFRVPLFAKNARAAAALEFGFIAAPLLLTVIAVFQSALFVYFSGALDYATQTAARKIMTGSIQNQSLTATQFRNNILCPLLPAAMSCSSIIVNLQTFSESGVPSGFYNFVNATQSGLVIPPLDNTQTAFCPGSGGTYVFLQVLYAMPLLGAVWLPSTNVTYNGQTVKLVMSTAAFKNEPYQATSTPTYPGC